MVDKAGAPVSKQLGDEAEALALAHLQAHGLRLVERNYRVARGPSARGGEIDLVMRDRGTLVFVEVRSRASGRHGGAAASVTAVKQARLVRTAQHYLMRFATLPACRFDVVCVEPGGIEWIRAAFDAG